MKPEFDFEKPKCLLCNGTCKWHGEKCPECFGKGYTEPYKHGCPHDHNPDRELKSSEPIITTDNG